VSSKSELKKEINYSKQIQKILPSALFTVDTNMVVTSWNNKIADITGYSADEAIGQKCSFFARTPCGEKCGLFSNDVRKPISNKQCTICDKFGNIHTIIKNADLLYDENGRVVGGIETFEDITEIMNVRDEMKQSQERYQYLFDSSPISIWEEDFSGAFFYIQELKKRGVKDFRKYFSENVDEAVLCSNKVKILDVNRATLDMFGAKNKNDLITNLGQIFTEDSFKTFIIQLAHIAEGKKLFEGECINKTIDGKEINVVLRWTPIKGYEHDYSRVLVNIIDVTETKQIEHDQIISEEKYRKMFELSPESIILIDNKGVIIDINHRVTDWLGYNAELIKGKTIMELPFIDKRNKVLMIKQFRSRQKGETVQPYELEFITKAGEVRIGRILGTTTTESDFTYNLLMVMDVTESVEVKETLRKAKEAAEDATRAKADFLASMSHEIRTPMNGVIGMAELLAGTELNTEQREFVEIIRASGDSLLTIINDILDFSKIESQKMELEEKPFEIRTCIEETFDLVSTKAAEKKLDLLYFIKPDVPVSIYGDITRLRQILVNLVNNAIKFTEKGEIYIEVDRLTKRRNSIALKFSVRDTGIGIPEDKQNRLFKSFSQVDSSTTRKYGGTGLGLAICKQLSELMGGNIWVESEEGKGSTFHFTILEKPAPQVSKTYLADKVPELKGKHILIVDDNETNRLILLLQCKQWGLIPKTVSSGLEALEELKRNTKYDLAILDMQMPEMDGLELGKKIRGMKKTEKLPLLMLSSLGVNPSLENDNIIDLFLPKPVKQSNLFDAIMKCLGEEAIEKFTQSHIKQLDETLADKIPLNILVAEDNAINQKLALKVLEKMGYAAQIASNGVKVLKALESQKYDLIFMDVQMPEMDGLEATARIIEKYTEDRPRIIAMTANAMQGDKERCLEAGMDDYISKPIRFAEINRVINKWGGNNIEQNITIEEPASDIDIMDWQIVDSVRDLDDGDEAGTILAELVQTFINEFTDNIEKLKTILEAENEEELRMLAHKMKGAAANLGAKKFAELCSKMEDKAKQDDLKDISELIDQLIETADKTWNEYKNYLIKLGHQINI